MVIYDADDNIIACNGNCECHHCCIPYDDEDGNRKADCLQCNTTLVFKPGEVLTEAEIEARQQARQEARAT